jgi:hypothetical protein
MLIYIIMSAQHDIEYLAKLLKSHIGEEELRNIKLRPVIKPTTMFDALPNEVNLFKGFLFKNTKPFQEFDNQIQEKVKEFLNDYVRDCLCRGEGTTYIYVMKWLANMVKGNKNTTALFFSGEQAERIQLTTILQEYVLGPSLCEIFNTSALKNEYNIKLMGKLLVEFQADDINVETMAQFKDYISTNYATYTKKYCRYSPIFINNINNYIVSGRGNEILTSDTRRVKTIHVSNNHINVCNKILDGMEDLTEFGEALFCYLREIRGSNSATQY